MLGSRKWIRLAGRGKRNVTSSEPSQVSSGTTTVRAAAEGRVGDSATSTLTPGLISFSAGDYWYHSHSHADFQICRELAKSRRVLIINSMGMRVPSLTSADGWMRVRRKLNSTLHFVRRPAPNITVLSPLFIPVYGPGWAAALNQKLVELQIRAVARWAGGYTDRLVANPTAWGVARKLGTGPLVLYRVDHFSATEDVDSALIRRLEDVTFAEADTVLYSSEALMDNEAVRHRGKGELFEHGVDRSLFDPTRTWDEPADLRDVAHPRVVMMGSFEKADRLAQTLEIAAALPEVSFVFVGGGGGAVKGSERATSNVTFVGQKQPSELPAYLAHMEVGLVVVTRSEWGTAASPIKLKEYLAMGLPVVSTWFDGVEKHSATIRYGDSTESVVAALRATLVDLGPSNHSHRIESVAADGWDARAQLLSTRLEQLREAQLHS